MNKHAQFACLKPINAICWKRDPKHALEIFSARLSLTISKYPYLYFLKVLGACKLKK